MAVGMGMGGMIDVLFFASGVYLVYTAVMAKRRGDIAANVMLSKNVSEKDIIDKVGFIEYMYKRIILVGVIILTASVVHLVNDYYIHSKALTWVGIGAILAAIVMYSLTYKRGQRIYMAGQGRTSDSKKVK